MIFVRTDSNYDISIRPVESKYLHKILQHAGGYHFLWLHMDLQHWKWQCYLTEIVGSGGCQNRTS